MANRAWLVCGILASLLYVVADALGGFAWQGYSHASQSVSELMAVGAPSRPLVLSLMGVRSLLVLAFALGIWQAAAEKPVLRLAAIFVIADATIGQITASYFPAFQRGAVGSAVPHLIGTGLESLSIVLAMGFSAVALGRWFRLYSIATILTLLVFGALAGSDVSSIQAQLPTPWLGLVERVNIYAYLLWMAVLAVTLLRHGYRGRGIALDETLRAGG